jgi:hypothetical protein
MKQLIPYINVTFLLRRFIVLLTVLTTFLLAGEIRSQAFGAVICPINAGPDYSVCTPNCATLTGTVVPTYQTTSYATSVIPYAPDPFNAGTLVPLFDDQWSPAINLPFTFCFYGTAYNQILIGSNGLLSFNVAQAGGYCQWPIGNAVPSTFNPMNTIMGPWQDLNPYVGGQVRYQTYGTAPCRRFVVSWYQVPTYSCGSLCTQQLVLYERTNVIDNFIQSKVTCATWNGGYAIQALHNELLHLFRPDVISRQYGQRQTRVADGRQVVLQLSLRNGCRADRLFLCRTLR